MIKEIKTDKTIAHTIILIGDTTLDLIQTNKEAHHIINSLQTSLTATKNTTRNQTEEYQREKTEPEKTPITLVTIHTQEMKLF